MHCDLLRNLHDKFTALSLNHLWQCLRTCFPNSPFFNLCVFLGCVKLVAGEGMPTHRNPQEKGDLAVSFDIEFPPENFITDGLMVC